MIVGGVGNIEPFLVDDTEVEQLGHPIQLPWVTDYYSYTPTYFLSL